MSGFAMLHRTLLDHPAFRNAAEAMAFGFMVMRASWRPTVVRYKGHRIELQRGQLALSQRDMAVAMDRDKAWIERLWKRLRSEAMIEVRSEAGVAVITICNYDKYQAVSPTGEAADEAREPVDMRQTRGTEQQENNSVPNGTGECADLVKELFDLGVELLKSQGHNERESRSILGKWRKGRSDGEIVSALVDAKTRSISNLVEWMPRRLKATGPPGGNFMEHYEREVAASRMSAT